MSGPSTPGRPLQLVDARGSFNNIDTEDYIADFVLADEDPNADAGELVCVSVLGARRSGKSTFLNSLFSTAFSVTKPFAPKTSGTVGAWMAAVPRQDGHPMVAIDCQGHDAADAQPDDKVARITSLALALSDVLVFNMWAADVGRYEAAGYGLLRRVFAEYMHVFGVDEDRSTILLFVLRDHDDGSSLESLATLIRDDANKIWKDLEKPDHYAGAQLSELFELTFTSLPSIRYRKEEFDQAIGSLRQRFFDSTAPGFLLNPEASKGIPGDALATYAEVVWSDLGKDGGMSDLPPDADSQLVPRAPGAPVSAADLAAAFRCDVAYDEQRKIGMAAITRWRADIDRGRIIDKFKRQSEAMVENAMDKFDQATAIHVGTPEYTKRSKQLASTLNGGVSALVDRQVKFLQNQAIQKLKAELSKTASTTGRISGETQATTVSDLETWFAGKMTDLVGDAPAAATARSARTEVGAVLRDFASKFNDTPTMQIQAMRRIERRARRRPAKVRGYQMGVTVTGAIRPKGFGNFQMITGYSKGPHQMNLVVCNDADASEQEGQGKVPLLRFQPSLTFDIDA